MQKDSSTLTHNCKKRKRIEMYTTKTIIKEYNLKEKDTININ